MHNEDSTLTHRLHTILRQSGTLYAMLAQIEALGLPNAYLAAGCIAQTVWNAQVGNAPLYGIADIDLVYYDGADLSFAAEDRAIERVRQAFQGIALPVDVKNQARVHLWYEQRFHKAIPPYPSAEAAIATWPTTASAIGVRLEAGALAVCAPFGLRDLFGQVVRPNKALVSESVYMEKALKWQRKWPALHILPW